MNIDYEFNYMLRFSRVTDTVYGNKNERNYGKNKAESQFTDLCVNWGWHFEGVRD